MKFKFLWAYGVCASERISGRAQSEARSARVETHEWERREFTHLSLVIYRVCVCIDACRREHE